MISLSLFLLTAPSYLFLSFSISFFSFFPSLLFSLLNPPCFFFLCHILLFCILSYLFLSSFHLISPPSILSISIISPSFSFLVYLMIYLHLQHYPLLLLLSTHFQLSFDLLHLSIIFYIHQLNHFSLSSLFTVSSTFFHHSLYTFILSSLFLLFYSHYFHPPTSFT